MFDNIDRGMILSKDDIDSKRTFRKYQREVNIDAQYKFKNFSQVLSAHYKLRFFKKSKKCFIFSTIIN